MNKRQLITINTTWTKASNHQQQQVNEETFRNPPFTPLRWRDVHLASRNCHYARTLGSWDLPRYFEADYASSTAETLQLGSYLKHLKDMSFRFEHLINLKWTLYHQYLYLSGSNNELMKELYVSNPLPSGHCKWSLWGVGSTSTLLQRERVTSKTAVFNLLHENLNLWGIKSLQSWWPSKSRRMRGSHLSHEPQAFEPFWFTESREKILSTIKPQPV